MRLSSAFPESSGFVNKSLTRFAERAVVAADRSRFAALPARYLDDIGMTASERAAALGYLGYEEPMIDAWRVVASHL